MDAALRGLFVPDDVRNRQQITYTGSEKAGRPFVGQPLFHVNMCISHLPGRQFLNLAKMLLCLSVIADSDCQDPSSIFRLLPKLPLKTESIFFVRKRRESDP